MQMILSKNPYGDHAKYSHSFHLMAGMHCVDTIAQHYNGIATLQELKLVRDEKPCLAGKSCWAQHA